MARASFRAALLAGLLIPALACSSDPGVGDATFTVRDSAGIRIVENSGAAWGAGEEWTVAGEPEWVVGYEDELLLSGVQMVDVNADGRVSVVHQSDQQILILGPDGALLSRIGRRGEGPGEFQSVGMVFWLPGDTLMAVDWGAGRISYFDRDGEFARSIEQPRQLLEARNPETVGVLDDGTLVLSAWNMGDIGEDRVADSHLVRASSSFQNPELLGRTATAVCMGTSGCPLDPFGPLGTIGVRGDLIVHGFGSEYAIRYFGPSTGLRQIARLEHPPLAVDVPMLQRFREDWGQAGEDPEQLDRMIANRGGPPTTLPHFLRLVVDSRGHTWLEERENLADGFERTWPVPPEPLAWGVFDPEGVFLGRVRVPARLDVQAIGPDYIVGVYRDELDVETIRRYRLERN